MKQPIPRSMHGILDYVYVPVVASLPNLVGFAEEKPAATFSRLLSATVLTSTLLTRAEWGAVKIIPFKTHLAIDALGSTLALTASLLPGIAKNKKARTTLLIVGLFGLAVVALSQPKNMMFSK